MKSTILIIGGLLIVVNILFGLMLTVYAPFNMWMNTAIIAVTTALMFIVNALQIKDAFKVALTIFLPISGLVKLILCFFSPERLVDNWCVIVLVIITVIETITCFIMYKTSQYISR